MAFTVSLFKTNSENNRLTKTLTNEKQLTGTLKEQTSILNPSIVISSDENISTYNYAYISEFGRYYYITDIVSARNGLWRVQLRCDVLMSYKDEIKNVTGVVVRQESNPNKLLIDRLERIQNDKQIDFLYYPESFSKNLQYILVTAGGQNG